MSEFNLLRWNVERDSAKIHFDNVIRAWNNAEQTYQHMPSSKHCKHVQIIIYTESNAKLRHANKIIMSLGTALRFRLVVCRRTDEYAHGETIRADGKMFFLRF